MLDGAVIKGREFAASNRAFCLPVETVEIYIESEGEKYHCQNNGGGAKDNKDFIPLRIHERNTILSGHKNSGARLLLGEIVSLFHFEKLSFVSGGQIIPLTDPFLKSLPGRNLTCVKVRQYCKIIGYNIALN